MADRAIPAPPTTAPDPAVEHLAEGFDDGLAWKRVRFRGITYKLIELDIGTYDDIQKKATMTRVVDGNDQEFIDNVLQNRMMLDKSLVEPARGAAGYKSPTQMGTRLFLNLQREVQGLHFDREEDELRDKDGKPKPPDPDESKGNASAPES